MAVAMEGSRFGAGARDTLKRGISSSAAGIGRFGEIARRVGGKPAAAIAVHARSLARRMHLYDFLTYGPLIRFVTRTLGRRIIFANSIGLLILLGGIFYLSQYHAWLIDAKRDSLRAQGEIVAAAIAANATVETGRIVLDPDRLPELEGSRSPFRDDAFAALQLPIAPERVTPIVRRLLPSTDTRARVYAQDGTLIVDTAQLLTRGQVARPGDDQQGGRVKVKNAWTRFMAWLTRGDLPVYREIGTANGTAYPEVRMALTSGWATPMLLVNEKGEQIVSMAVPIQYRKATLGVLLLSTRPGEIDEILAEERNIIVALALIALAATLLASMVLARTIAGPMRRLSEAAENVSRNIRTRHDLPQLSRRADEVGQMAAAFRKMTASLYQRIEASERFAEDVAHELKNPLTAARSTAEALAYAKTPETRQVLMREIQEELKRLNKLITDVSNAARMDAQLAIEEIEPVDVRDVLRGVVDVFNDMLAHDTKRVVLDIVAAPDNPVAFIVQAHEVRLGRVITNLLDNAISFSPDGGVVTVSARSTGNEVEIIVDDQGPGIPAENMEAIFKRFYSDRPQTDRTVGKNSGLGLSMSREIVTTYGGRIWASNRMAGPDAPERAAENQTTLAEGVAGARFIVRLPAAGPASSRGAPLRGRRS
jgi:two-component system sensor histidine kinase ChvG